MAAFFPSSEGVMSVVYVAWLAVVCVCGATTEAEEATAAAVWWRAAGEDLVRAWAKNQEAISVTLLIIANGAFLSVGGR